MKRILVLATLSALTFAGDRKPLPGQAGNDAIELVGSVLIERQEVLQAVGMYVGPGYIAVRMKVSPKTDKPLRISPDDFTIVSGKDGQRSQALSPGQIAGKGALVVKAAPNQPGGYGTTTNGPIWGGIGGIGGTRPPGSGHPAASPGGKDDDPKLDTGSVDKKDDKTEKDSNPLMDALKAKELPEKESTEPLEGLLYFPIDGKIKPKDLRVIYKGPAGRLIMEFANPK